MQNRPRGNRNTAYFKTRIIVRRARQVLFFSSSVINGCDFDVFGFFSCRFDNGFSNIRIAIRKERNIRNNAVILIAIKNIRRKKYSNQRNAYS